MFPGETVLSGCKLATTEDFRVLRSAAGHYVGTLQHGAPCTRETGYFPSREAADEALATFVATGELPQRRR